MLEAIVAILAIIGLGCVICTLVLGVWIAVAGTREGDVIVEPPTLDVQNHVGDPDVQRRVREMSSGLFG